MNSDLLLIVLGSLIPLLLVIFVRSLLDWQNDLSADREAAIADRADTWSLSWDFWGRQALADNPNRRRLAIQMQGFLYATHPDRDA